MKKKRIIIVSLCIFAVLLVLFISFFPREKVTVDDKINQDDYFILYTFSDNRKVYSEFNKVKYTSKSGKEDDLSNALKDNLTTMEDIVKKAKDKDGLNDGGTIIYYFNNYEIVKCHRIISNSNDTKYNEDYYILDNSSKVIDNICK